MDTKFFTYVFIMAGVTYLIRMVPMVVFKNKIENQFVQSFLFYVPYAVLAAMTIPDIFYSTSSFISAFAGLLVAVLLALKGKKLLPVAMSACAAVYIVEIFL